MKKQLLLYFLLSLFFVSKAQYGTVLLDEGVEKKIVISYKKQQKEYARNNQIIEHILKSQGGTLEDIRLNYKVKEYHKISQTDKSINLWVSIGNLVLEEEYNYLKFPINQLLIPSEISFYAHWKDEKDVEIERSIFTHEKFKSGADLFKKKVPDNPKAKGSKLFLDHLNLFFSEKDVEKFNDFIQSVDAYYNADARLNMLNQALDKIKLDTLELLNAFYQTTIEHENYFEQLKQLKLISKLNLKVIDPIGFNSHFGKTQVRNRTLKKAIEHTKKNMHEAYYKKGLDHLKWGNKKKAKLFFGKSIKEKNSYAPPFYELANMDFKDKKYEAVLDSCASILNHKKPDNDTRYNILQLIDKVILINIEKIKDLVETSFFNLALEQLTYCQNYLKNVEGVRKYPELDDMQEFIYKGMYNDLAKAAENFIKKEELEKAQQSIDTLMKFRENGDKYFINPKKQEDLLIKLHKGFVRKGKVYLDNENIDSALYALTSADKICQTYTFVACENELTALLYQVYNENYKHLIVLTEEAVNENLPDSALHLIEQANALQKKQRLSINSKIDTLYLQSKQLKYNGLIAEGEIALKGGDGQQALAFFEEATQISETIKINEDVDLENKKKQAGVAYILTICSQAETFVEALQLDKARLGLNKSNAVLRTYHLEDNEEAKQTIEKLADLLKQGRCNEIQLDFNVQQGAAVRFIEKLDFENAQNSLKQAKQIARNAKKCNLNEQKIDSLSTEIQSIAFYMQQLKKVNRMIKNKNHNSAIVLYKEIMKYYADSVKNNFGIVCDSLFDFIKKHSDNEFLNYSVIYYTEQSQEEKALNLLDELYARNYIASWSKESQTTLGTYLANQDFAEDNEADPKEKVSHYTHDLFWFKYLKKAYLNHWKNLSIP